MTASEWHRLECRNPSRKHEIRRATLQGVATLAGFETCLSLPWGMIPDVCRVSLKDGRFFIGDAKESENPYELKMLGRLERYMRWLSLWHRDSEPDFFCVCHPASHGEEWQRVLVLLAETVGVSIGRVGLRVLSGEATLTWLTCYGAIRGVEFSPRGETRIFML